MWSLLFKNINGVAALVSVLGLIVSYFAVFKAKKKVSIVVIVFCIVICVLVIFNSRAAIISFTLPFFIFINPRKKLLVPICFLLILFSFFYKYKSSQGRLLIWKICITQGHFSAFGNGINSFEKDYPALQRIYFESHNNSQEMLLADDVHYAFNEPIQAFYEIGIIGVLLLIILIFFTIYFALAINNKLYLSIIVSLLLNSLFYYTFHETSLLIIYIFASLQILFHTYNFFFKSHENKYILSRLIGILFISLSPLYFLYKHYKNVETIKEYENYNFQENFSYLDNAPKKTNNNYLNLKIAELFANGYLHKGDTLKAISILEKYKKCYQGYDLLLFLGKCYFISGKPELAIDNFIDASNTIPSRFEPIYMIMQSYIYENKTDSAQVIAKRILAKPIKIPSSIIAYYLTNAQKTLLR